MYSIVVGLKPSWIFNRDKSILQLACAFWNRVAGERQWWTNVCLVALGKGKFSRTV